MVVFPQQAIGCCWMYKCTNFLANHNQSSLVDCGIKLLLDVQMY